MDNEFGCSNGLCIPMMKRCDGISDCINDFDEINCTLVLLNEQLYRKESPPLEMNGIIEVKVNLTILDIGIIDEIKQTVDIKFSIWIQW